MSGEYGKLYKRAWGDRDFKALTAHEQLQYLKLISQPDVSMAGILTHASMRWAGQTSDLNAADIDRALQGLERARFIAYDRETQELLIRSYIRNDGGWKSPLTMKGDSRSSATLAPPPFASTSTKLCGSMPASADCAAASASSDMNPTET